MCDVPKVDVPAQGSSMGGVQIGLGAAVTRFKRVLLYLIKLLPCSNSASCHQLRMSSLAYSSAIVS